MVLEATVICVDNSEWMRNGDYAPSRFQAQADAVNLICGAKTQSNPENTVGVLTMAGKGVRVLVTPTADLGRILSSMHGLEIGGDTNILAGVQVAQLALKHRQNKNQRQRIVLFVGSPVGADSETLVRIGKKLKKNNVALDIVSFGEEEDGKQQKLESFLTAVNSNDNSHLIHVPSGPAILSDVLISSPVFTGDGEGGSGFAAAAAAGAAAAVAAGGLGGDFDFGVDPNLDPELALALRVSMEEERARQEAASRRAAEENGEGAEDAKGEEGASTAAVAGEEEVVMADGGGEGSSKDAATSVSREGLVRSSEEAEPMDEEDALLQQAVSLSMGAAAAAGAASTSAAFSTDRIDEDEDLSLALQLSLQQQQEAAGGGEKQAGNSGAGAAGVMDMAEVLGNSSFMSSVLASLPGVDPNDPSVREVLASLNNSQQKDSTKKEEDADKQ